MKYENNIERRAYSKLSAGVEAGCHMPNPFKLRIYAPLYPVLKFQENKRWLSGHPCELAHAQ